MDLENALISKVIESGDLRLVVDNKITPEFFYNKNKLVFSMMLRHYREYRKSPSLEAIQREFGDFTPENTTEPIEYYVDQIRKRYKRNMIITGIKEVAGKLENETEDEAELYLYQLTSRLATEVKLTKDLNYALDIESRKERYLHKKEHCGVDGIPTLITPVDDITGGAHGGELITILGQPGTGKTWIELVIAKAALKEGYRVLFITKEMEPEQIATRMDSALLEMPFDHIRRGLLGDKYEQEYFQKLEDLNGEYPDFIISGDDGEGGVTAIQAKIEEHNPDMVIIDGSYLIIDEDGGKAAHEKATNITRRLKRLARKTQLPIYNSTQAGRQTKRSNAPDMEDVSFSYAYAQDSDIMMSIYRTDEMKVASKMGLKLIKVRDGNNSGHYVLNWDFEEMHSFGTLARDLSDSVGLDEDKDLITY
jgi:replicative DNA helicase